MAQVSGGNIFSDWWTDNAQHLIDSKRSCAHCGGTGLIEVYTNETYMGFPTFDLVTCTVCGGIGIQPGIMM